MGMGRRPQHQQSDLWVTTADLPQSPGHAFYDKLNALLAEDGFDRHVEDLCRPYYAEGQGRDSIPPGVYFRMLLVGYFEALDSQRGIAWRCSDSLSLRAFLGIPLSEATPDHSSLTKARQRPPLELLQTLGPAGEDVLKPRKVNGFDRRPRHVAEEKV